MGLDDAVYDSNIIVMIEKYVEQFANYYSEKDDLTEKNLNKWERSRCYTGYSVAFHTLYPLYANTHYDGCMTDKMTPESKKKIQLLVRSKLVNIIKNKKK